LLGLAEQLWVPGTKREAGKLRTKARRLREQALRLLSPNLGSPQQLKELLYEELGLPEQRSREGGVTTDEDALVELLRRAAAPRFAHALPVLEAIQAWREASALTKYVTHEARVIHPSWMMHTTATGRLSCLDPNMQNIPQRDAWAAELIRPIFVPVQHGNELSQFDYSQIERRLQAVLSHDEALLSIFARKGDVHREMASLALGVARRCAVPVSEVTDAERYLFKRAVYLEGYGGGWLKLQKVLAKEGVVLDIEQAKETMRLIKAATPRYNEFREELLEEARRERVLRNPFGRIRWFLGPSFGDALNFPFQSAAADVMLEAMGRLALPREAVVVAQIHDALVVEHPRALRVDVEAAVREALEAPCEALDGWSCPVDVKHGGDWRFSGDS
jgi:DNA polymerase-1